MSLNMDWQSSENEEMEDGYIGRMLATALTLWRSLKQQQPFTDYIFTHVCMATITAHVVCSYILSGGAH